MNVISESQGNIYKSYKNVFPESRKDEIMCALDELCSNIERLKHSKFRSKKRPIKVHLEQKNDEVQLKDSNIFISTQQKCQLLEQQIDELKKLLGKTVKPNNSNHKLEQKDENFTSHINATNNLTKTEFDDLKLTIAHNLTQKKIDELEKQNIYLNEDDQNLNTDDPKQYTSRKWRKKSRPISDEIVGMKIRPATYSSKLTNQSNSTTMPHRLTKEYKVNLTEIPFLTGKSAGKSHSLSANFQEVLSLMKFNNSKICGQPINVGCHRSCDCYKHNTPSSLSASLSHHHPHRHKCKSTSKILSPIQDVNNNNEDSHRGDDDSLMVLLAQLNDELMHLKVTHEELTKLSRTKPENLIKDAKSQLKLIEQEMELKTSQISQLHLQTHHELPTKSATIKRCQSGNFKLEIKDTKCVPSIRVNSAIYPNSNKQKYADLLKNLKYIQNTLRNN